MKRLILGDIHGHWDIIDKIYWKELPDEVIILGDYVDSFAINTDDQYECFQNILTLRNIHNKKHEKQFNLLLGNHDFHYIIDTEQYSGYNWRTESWARSKFIELLDDKVFSFCYLDDKNKIIYSHAGISNTWLNVTCNSELIHPGVASIEEINNLPLILFKFNRGNSSDIYGNSTTQGPLWIRPSALSNDMYHDSTWETWTQIVGHTNMKKPTWVNEKLLVLDCLPNGYCIENIDDKGVLINRNVIELC